MGSFGLAQALWNVSVGPRVSYMSAVSAVLLVVGIAALVASVRSNELGQFTERRADS